MANEILAERSVTTDAGETYQVAVFADGALRVNPAGHGEAWKRPNTTTLEAVATALVRQDAHSPTDNG